MSLTPFFHPASIAVIGASIKSHSVGKKVFNNLIRNHFSGKLYAVNPKHQRINGKECFASVAEIPDNIDLAVITTPAQTVPSILIECGKKGIRAAVIISSGFSETGKIGKELEQFMLTIARQYHMRLIGPNCLGVMRPHCNMNATFDNNFATPDGLALVSQSGAISAAILDWAIHKKIGFSSLISLGNCVDVDFGDVLKFLATDPFTKSILLYIEGIHDAHRFINGLRSAARTKPIIAIKGGKNQQGSRAALSHTGAIVGDDDVFDVALQRAGVVRVMTIEELFTAAEILSRVTYEIKDKRLMIITNGGGAGVMAADCAFERNVTLSTLSDFAKSALDKVLPVQWSHQNPIDIIGDATPKRYHDTLDICTKENVNGILTILVPVAMSNPIKVAEQIIEDAKHSDKLIMACWMGEKQVKASWQLFEKNNIPYFDTPEKAVAAFSYLADYYHHQQLLSQTLKPLCFEKKPDTVIARFVIDLALKENRNLLTTSESKKILKAFYIPTTETIIAKDQNEVMRAAKSLSFPIVMKIHSPDITHKQDIGGVELNIINEEAAKFAFHKIITHAKNACPNATILGVTVEPMLQDPNNREVMIGVIYDKVFGPVISFGAGGSLVEIIKDRGLALPPLNTFIANHLIKKTRISKALEKFRNMPAVCLDQLINMLLRVSEMVCELPEIQEMDINPILINDKNAIAVDVRIMIAPAA